jgi:hypothetical protein
MWLLVVLVPLAVNAISRTNGGLNPICQKLGRSLSQVETGPSHSETTNFEARLTAAAGDGADIECAEIRMQREAFPGECMHIFAPTNALHGLKRARVLLTLRTNARSDPTPAIYVAIIAQITWVYGHCVIDCGFRHRSEYGDL